MSKVIILHIMLVIHLIAFAMSIGITLANTVAYGQFWKLYDKNKEQGLAAFRATTKCRVFGIIGLMALILTGIIMLWLFNWFLGQLLWFKIKMLIVVLVFVNGFTLGRITSEKLEVLLSHGNNSADLKPETTRLRRNMQIFQIMQLSLFIVIVILTVFRFN